MKKIIAFIVLVSYVIMTLPAASIKIVGTTYEDQLLNSVGITNSNYSFVEGKGWYFKNDGIDKTAKRMVGELPVNEDVILYGISLGGTVARRMTQIAAENGKSVKGYIAQSSPLSGDRLTNTAWATTSLGILAVYATAGLGTLALGLPWEDFFGVVLSRGEYDFCSELDEKTKAVITRCDDIVNNKAIDRNDKQSVIENVTLPLLDLIFGNDENRSEMFDYFKSVFMSSKNNVKDLDPTGDFMVNVMNSSSEKAKEVKDTIKRAFIVSTNGNIYETSAWSAAEPILTFYQNQRDSYWARAKKEWWNFAYWALRSAASEVSVATVEGVPRAWSTCVSGSPDYTTNDCFVPTKDNFWGKELKMTAPNMRGVTKDISIVCDKVSHLDYAVGFDDLPNIQGRTYFRELSVKQQQIAIMQALDFFMK